MSIIIPVGICFFVSASLSASNATLCADVFSDCVDLDPDLCNITIVKAACPATCEWNSTTCKETCQVFDFLGPMAFAGYGILLLLIVIISVLVYSACVDGKPQKSSSERFSRQKKRSLDIIAAQPLRGDPEIIVLNPNKTNVNRSEPNALRDLLINSSVSRDSFDFEEKKAVESKSTGFNIIEDEVNEAEGYFDPDDDFFKHHSLHSADTSEFEPPLSPQQGGHRSSRKALRKAERWNALDSSKKSRPANSPGSASQHLTPSLLNSTSLTPKVLQELNQRLAIKFSVESSSYSPMAQPGTASASKKLYGEPSGTLSPLGGSTLESKSRDALLEECRESSQALLPENLLHKQVGECGLTPSMFNSLSPINSIDRLSPSLLLMNSSVRIPSKEVELVLKDGAEEVSNKNYLRETAGSI